MLCFSENGQYLPKPTQGAFDAATCLLIYGIAQALEPRTSVPAAIAAALNPTQIVLSALVLTDTPFLFLVALFLFAASRWLRSHHGSGRSLPVSGLARQP